MQSQLLEEASRVISTPQILVNVVSRRVRQLMQGHRPLVEVTPRMGFADTALQEVIDRKITFEMTVDPRADAVIVPLPGLSLFKPRERAA